MRLKEKYILNKFDAVTRRTKRMHAITAPVKIKHLRDISLKTSKATY